MRSMPSLSRIFKLIGAHFLLLIAPALAQVETPTPLPPSTCGLPLQGNILTDATYTLTGNCTMTGHLLIGDQNAESPAKITVTINGGTHSIIGRSGETTITVRDHVEFNLNNVTISGGGRPYGSEGVVYMVGSLHSATISNVTFSGTAGPALWMGSPHGTPITHSLSSILVEDSSTDYFNYAHGMPAGIHAIGQTSLNINNIVFRNIARGNAALGANDSYQQGVTDSLGTITFSGCLTADGVAPQVYYGNIVDNSTGQCSGTIGNGGTTAIEYPQKANAACGLPDGGFVYGSQTFTLSGNCRLSETLLLTGDSNVVINGNGKTIDLNSLTVGMRSWGDLTLRNVVVTNAGLAPIITYLNKRVQISNSRFHNNAGPLIFQDVNATLERVTIEDHTIAAERPTWPSAIYVNLSARLTIRDSIIRRNSGGVGAIFTGISYQYGSDPVTRQIGNIAFESNSPTDIHDPNGFWRIGEDKPAAAKKPDQGGGGGARQATRAESRVSTGQALMANTDIEVSTTYGLGSGIQFQQRDAGSVGIQSLIDGGIIEVVDVWGYAEQNWEICFPQDGSLVFLDAALMPRAPAPISAYRNEAGMVCAADNRAGTIVVVPLSSPYASGAPPARSTPEKSERADKTAPAKTAPERTTLAQCMVNTMAVVNFRQSPGGKRLGDFIDPHGDIIAGWLPKNVTLTASERTPGWFKVDYHGLLGWISADWLRPQGACG